MATETNKGLIALAFITCVLVWSTTPLTVKWSSSGLDPVTGLSFRMLIAALIGSLAVKIFAIEIRLDRQALLTYLAVNLGLTVSMLLVYFASVRVPSGLISVLFGLSPIISGLMGQFLLRETKFSFLQWLALTCALSGLVFIFRGEVKGLDPIGVFMLLVGVSAFCLSSVLVKKIGAEMHPLAMTVGALWMAAPLYIVIWFLWVGELHAGNVKAWASILYLAFFGSIVALIAYYWMLKRVTPSAANLSTLINPVLALYFGLVFNNESLHMGVAIGVGLIISGLVIFNFGDRVIRYVLLR